MDEGLLNFWRTLNRNNVIYIMVGGFAVNMNGFIRATKDSDLWLKDTLANRSNFQYLYHQSLSALFEYGINDSVN